MGDRSLTLPYGSADSILGEDNEICTYSDASTYNFTSMTPTTGCVAIESHTDSTGTPARSAPPEEVLLEPSFCYIEVGNQYNFLQLLDNDEDWGLDDHGTVASKAVFLEDEEDCPALSLEQDRVSSIDTHTQSFPPELASTIPQKLPKRFAGSRRHQRVKDRIGAFAAARQYGIGAAFNVPRTRS
jgi:hypothetical protein